MSIKQVIFLEIIIVLSPLAINWQHEFNEQARDSTELNYGYRIHETHPERYGLAAVQ